MSRIHPDTRILEIAAGQHGVVSGGQLRKAGMSRGAIEHRLRIGTLRPVHRGVYRTEPTTPKHQAEAAALLALVTLDQVRALAGRYRGQPGRGKLQALLDDIAEPALTRSPPELLLLKRLRKAGVPRPRTNARILRLTDGQYAFYGHLQPGSIRVHPGERVERARPTGPHRSPASTPPSAPPPARSSIP